MKDGGRKIAKVAIAVIAVATLVSAVYIMIHGIGLSDELDFGAGAYYYADIPEFDKYEKAASGFSTSVPVWVHILLFLAWGFLMYRLWVRIDRGRKH